MNRPESNRVLASPLSALLLVGVLQILSACIELGLRSRMPPDWAKVVSSLPVLLCALWLARPAARPSQDRLAMPRALPSALALGVSLGVLCSLLGAALAAAGRDVSTSCEPATVSGVALLRSVGVAPVLEELLFTGFLFGSLRHRMPVVVAIVLVAASFSLLHLPVTLSAFTTRCLVSTLCCSLFYRSRRLWVPVVLHLAINASLIALDAQAPSVCQALLSTSTSALVPLHLLALGAGFALCARWLLTELADSALPYRRVEIRFRRPPPEAATSWPAPRHRVHSSARHGHGEGPRSP